MDQFYFDLAKAAQWMWDNREKPQYWEWHDLTDRNPDQTNLGLSDAAAWNIFTVLESKKLIHEFTFTKDGKQQTGYKIDLSDPKAWKDIRRQPRWCEAKRGRS